MMGSPVLLNLRNLAWHGFLLADQLSLGLAATLLLLIHSIGHLLQLR
jgi:hypothetical protein